MPCFTRPLTNPLSMAATTNSCLLSLPPFFTKNTLCCSYPLKAISTISLTSSFTLFPSSLSIKKTNTQFPNFVFAARQDDDNNTLVLEEEQEQEQEHVQDEELIILDDFEGGGVDEAEAGVDEAEAEAEQEQGQDEELIILDDFEGGVDDEAEAGVDEAEAEAEAEQEQGQDEELIISEDLEGGVVDVAEAAEEYQEPPENVRLYVGNLPYEIDCEQLAQLFSEAGVVEFAEVVYSRETDRSRGFGFVTMRTIEEAEKAVKLYHRYDLNGRPLTVNKSAPRGSRPERPPRTFQPTSSIYVGNISWDIDDARLEQVFSEHGKVVSARIVYDRVSGRSRGFGFVKMSSEAEMNEAIANLNGQTLYGRTIRVTAAEERPRRNMY